MFESLVRVGTNNIVDEDPEERSRRQRGHLLKMDISELGENEAMASYDFAKLNCEEPDKISIKRHHLQFTTDPLFNKRLLAFDSDSLKCLFLNVFEVLSTRFRQETTCKSSFLMNPQIKTSRNATAKQPLHL